MMPIYLNGPLYSVGEIDLIKYLLYKLNLSYTGIKYYYKCQLLILESLQSVGCKKIAALILSVHLETLCMWEIL